MTRPTPSRTRPQDWPERLAAHVAAHRGRAFAYGVHDCATFAAGWIAAVHGIDVLDGLRGTYTNEAEFEALLAQWGGFAPLVASVTAIHDLPPCPVAFARRGDLALVRVGNEEALGVLDTVAVTVPGFDRLRLVPRGAILHAWVI